MPHDSYCTAEAIEAYARKHGGSVDDWCDLGGPEMADLIEQVERHVDYAKALALTQDPRQN